MTEGRIRGIKKPAMAGTAPSVATRWGAVMIDWPWRLERLYVCPACGQRFYRTRREVRRFHAYCSVVGRDVKLKRLRRRNTT